MCSAISIRATIPFAFNQIFLMTTKPIHVHPPPPSLSQSPIYVINAQQLIPYILLPICLLFVWFYSVVVLKLHLQLIICRVVQQTTSIKHPVIVLLLIQSLFLFHSFGLQCFVLFRLGFLLIFSQEQ